MDFYRIRQKEIKKQVFVYPDWYVGPVRDLMTRGGHFYAVWDEEAGIWSTSDMDLVRLVDSDVERELREREALDNAGRMMLSMRSMETGIYRGFNHYVSERSETWKPLDRRLAFANTELRREDYASKRLPYSLEEGSTAAWDEILDVLYDPAERAKIEWAIGAVVSGDSKELQKFFVFYGAPGTGKSTVLNIIQALFEGYSTVFDARALGSGSNAFSLEAFKNNPLVAIQHDGDLSRVSDNTKLNQIVSHEEMPINEKFKGIYTTSLDAMLFMGTNQVVKITDSKSGLLRRMIDINPSNKLVPEDRYHQLMSQIDFELGAIAHKCLQRYLAMGRNYYSAYRATDMLLASNDFAGFIEYYYDIFRDHDGVTMQRAWELYKAYCEETNTPMRSRRDVAAELHDYFHNFQERVRLEDGSQPRNYYSGFKGLDNRPTEIDIPENELPITLEHFKPGVHECVLNGVLAEMPAQYATEEGVPGLPWDDVTTTLADLDPTRLHYVMVPEHHIVIDFDIVNEDGEKDLQLNLEAAANWPVTYAEISQGGHGLHLHYYYSGDVSELAREYDVGIEVKALTGKQSLRRRLSSCNTLDIVTISGGLPKKEKKAVLDTQSIQTEKGLRQMVVRNLRKEIHPSTKSSIDFIHHILEEAYESGMHYNLLDMRAQILAFAAQSTNQSQTCLRIVQTMQLVGQNDMPARSDEEDSPIVFFDVEVYPNLFVICWMADDSDEVVKMINPTPQEVEALFKLKLVGFNNRRYDNHIIYARNLGYPNERLYEISQSIVNNNRSALFGEAYNLSYADIYDFASVKQGLKKWMIQLGVNKQEMDIPWDEPVPDDMIEKVVEYCCNDVRGTKAVFHHLEQDFKARQILAELSGLTVNHTTQAHTAKIIFGDDREASSKFVYTDLSEQFEGYSFNGKESTYRGEITGEGGYVYAEPGIHRDVALLDVASMHPTSIIELNLFGPYTQNFKALVDARLAIKNHEFEVARTLLDGRLAPFLVGAEDDPDAANGLAYALKIVINIVYGLTSARFENPFRDVRNVDNIVAKRGALFMVDLKLALQARGTTVAHIKTDSVKIPGATPEDIDFVVEFGKKYGYDFEHEATYNVLFLANDAVYVASPSDGVWTATGAQFQHPFVFKSLFSGEELEFADYCETKNVVQGVMMLDKVGDGDISTMTHVGRTGSFVPVVDGYALYRVKDGKSYAVTGTKGHLWVEADIAKQRMEDGELEIDMSYFYKLEADALKSIEEYEPFAEFVGPTTAKRAKIF